MSLLTQISELVTSITRPGTETSEGKNTRWVQIILYVLAAAEIILSCTVKGESYTGAAVVIAAIFGAMKTQKNYVDARTRLKETAAGILANPALSTVLDVIRTTATPDPEAEPPVVRPSIFTSSVNPIFPPTIKLKSPADSPAAAEKSRPPTVEILTEDGQVETQEFQTRTEAVTFANKLRASTDLPPNAKVHVL